MLYGLDLFSGIAGNSLGLREHVRTIAYCERDRHAQAVLLDRMAAGELPSAPICTDITRLDGRELRGYVDIIIGGFPCQDISCAGKGAGLEGERSGLFFEIVRLAKEIEPTFLFLENVPAIRTRGLDRVIQELTALGYDLRWTMLSAAEVGAPHKRERWFCLARRIVSDASIQSNQSQPGSLETFLGGASDKAGRAVCLGSGLVYSDSKQLSSIRTFQGGENSDSCGTDWWKAEPDVGRVADGVSLRVDRIKRLGNAVVPAQAKAAFEMLMMGKGIACH